MAVRVEKVVLRAGDQQAAVEFWTQKMGFEVAVDAPYGAERWIEVRAPGQDVAVVLSLREDGGEDGTESRPPARDDMPTSPLMFTCEDIHQAHKEMTSRGVTFTTPPSVMPFGWWAVFTDTDGERYALGQAT
jgi:predicted enzyme related to lactoylglutathione lyase